MTSPAMSGRAHDGGQKLARIEPVEWLTAAVGVANGVMIWFAGGRRPAAAWAIAADVLGAIVIVTVLPELRRARGAAVRYFGVALPLGCFFLLYLQTGLIDVAAVHWRDAELAGLQQLVLTRVPFVAATPLRDWLIVAYFSYDVFVAAAVLALFAPGNSVSQANATAAVRRTCYALAACFAIAFAVPALSPRYVNPGLQLLYLGQETALERLAAVAQNAGMVPGSSFPSAHLTAVTVLMWELWRTRRVAFWLSLPLVLSMSAGTVLLLFHYVPDVVAGILVGSGAIVLDHRAHRAPARSRP